MFSLPEGRIIFFVNSSMDMDPSFRPDANSLICFTWSTVYPAAFNSSADMFDILSANLYTDLLNMPEVIVPSFKPLVSAFWKASLSVNESSSFFSDSIILSIDTPYSSATLLNVSLYPDSSAIPWSRSCFQPDDKPPESIEFLASAESPIIFPILSEISVNNPLASSKSPIMISQDWVQPDCTASLRVFHNWVNVLTLVDASVAVLANFKIDIACSSVYPVSMSDFL